MLSGFRHLVNIETCWRYVTDYLMAPHAVVKYLDPLEDSPFYLISRFEYFVVHKLRFKRMEETLHLSIVPAAAAPAHTLTHRVKR